MQLQQAINTIFVQLSSTLQQMSDEEYQRTCGSLHGNTIGQHIRHIIELFQCLENGYEIGLVNYEKRNRDKNIETKKQLALDLLRGIYDKLDRSNKALKLEALYEEHATEAVVIDTNYFREVAYNLEHTIHHMALIRIGVTEVSAIALPEDFGVASSTVKYRKQCAQ
jgi:hypothetical protein